MNEHVFDDVSLQSLSWKIDELSRQIDSFIASRDNNQSCISYACQWCGGAHETNWCQWRNPYPQPPTSYYTPEPSYQMQPCSWDYNVYNPMENDQLQWESSYQEQPRGLYEDYWYGGVQDTMVEDNYFDMGLQESSSECYHFQEPCTSNLVNDTIHQVALPMVYDNNDYLWHNEGEDMLEKEVQNEPNKEDCLDESQAFEEVDIE